MSKLLVKFYILIITISVYAFLIFQINISISKNIKKAYFAKKLKISGYLFTENKREIAKYRVDTRSQNILLIGDSMSKWLRYRLQDYCEENNHKLSTVTWVSGNTKWFAETDTLKYYINKHSASYVILVLGSNELFIRDIATRRAKYVDKITETLNTVKWVWIGPPNWKNDTGINKLLENKLGNELFFLSKNLNFQRQKDGMHPTVKSCSMWVDSITSWITNTSQSRISLKYPTKKRKVLKPDALVLKPI